MRDVGPAIVDAHERVRGFYGSAIGRSKYEVVTPALVIDRDILLANLEYMEARLPETARAAASAREEPQEPPRGPTAARARGLWPLCGHGLGGDRHGHEPGPTTC